MAAIDLFCEIAENAFWRGQKDQEFRRLMKPGEFFMNLPPDVKERLSKMTSAEFGTVRIDAIAWMLGPPDERYVQFVRNHYEAERREYLRKHPHRGIDEEWDW